jgi:hypothetical protein
LTNWDLNRLRYTIRKLTGRYDTYQLPDTSYGENNISNPPGIDDYINDFYLYDMPEHFRTLKLRDFFTFSTIPNCGTYAVPENVIEIYDPIYVDNYQFKWYQYPAEFWQVWPELNFIDQNGATGNGSTTSFTFNLTQTPIQQGTVVIGMIPNPTAITSVANETFSDTDFAVPLDIPDQQYFNPVGTLTGTQGGTGTINYLTGAVTLNFVNPPDAGSYSSAHYHPYVASRPRDIMFYQQNLYIRPIPNDTYFVKVMSYMLPTTVMNAATNATTRPSLNVVGNNNVNIQGFSGSSGSLPTDLPQFNEWWQMIAYGASLKIFAEDGDMEEYGKLRPIFDEQMLLAQRKTLRQLAHQRTPTIYSQNASNNASWPIFPLYTILWTAFSIFSLGVL